MGWAAIVASILAFGNATAQDRAPDEELETITIPPAPSCVEQRTARFRWVETCAYKRRFDAVAAADRHAGNDLSPGLYEVSSGFSGLTLALDRDGWVGYRESADAGVSVGLEGRYSIRDGRVIVDLDEKDRAPHIAARQAFVIMRWSDRVVLVPEAAMGFLVNDLNTAFAHMGPLWNTTVLQRRRDSARDRLPCGLPSVSGEWHDRLHPVPVVATIVDARPDVAAATKDSPEDANLHHYRIELDAGSDAGLFEGMYLDDLGATSRPVWLRAIVDRVGAKKSSAQLNVIRESTTVSLDDVRIGAGIRLASGPPWKPRACVRPGARRTGSAHRPSSP